MCFIIFICRFDLCRKFRVIHCVFHFKYRNLLFMGRQAAPKIIPLTRKVQPLTRKVGVKFYGFIFWLKRIILGKFGIKNVLPIMTNHDRIAALLHDVFWKPHRQRGSLKPKYKAKTSRFLSTLRFLFGAPWETWTPMKLLSHGPEPCASANSAKGAYIKF